MTKLWFAPSVTSEQGVTTLCWVQLCAFESEVSPTNWKVRFLRQAHAKGTGQGIKVLSVAWVRGQLVTVCTWSSQYFSVIYSKQVVNERNKDRVFRPVLG